MKREILNILEEEGREDSFLKAFESFWRDTLI